MTIKIREVEKLKGLYQKVIKLLNDPIKMMDKALSLEAFHKACDVVHKRLLNRGEQCIGRGSILLHRDPLYTTDERRKWIEDEQLRQAELIYRSKDPVYTKAVDGQRAEIKSLLSEIEKCHYSLYEAFQVYPWTKDTLLAGNFEYFSKNYKSINKSWFVGEISEVIEILDKVQYALEREQKVDTADSTDTEQNGGEAGEKRKKKYVRPRNLIGSKEIVNGHKVPRTTLQAWQEKDSITPKKDPQTQENLYLRKWFDKKIQTYKPRNKKNK